MSSSGTAVATISIVSTTRTCSTTSTWTHSLPIAALIWQAGKFPTPCFTAYMLAADIPFSYQKLYEQLMPNCPAELVSQYTWGWLEPLVDKMKTDLIGLGRWDRHSVVLVYALVSYAFPSLSSLHPSLTLRFFGLFLLPLPPSLHLFTHLIVLSGSSFMHHLALLRLCLPTLTCAAPFWLTTSVSVCSSSISMS